MLYRPDFNLVALLIHCLQARTAFLQFQYLLLTWAQ